MPHWWNWLCRWASLHARKEAIRDYVRYAYPGVHLKRQQAPVESLEPRMLLSASFQGRVFEDGNGNGVFEPALGEVGLVGVRVELSGDLFLGEQSQAFTDSHGVFLLDDAGDGYEAGEFTVAVDASTLPANYEVTYPKPGSRSISTDSAETGIDFGAAHGEIEFIVSDASDSGAAYNGDGSMNLHQAIAAAAARPGHDVIRLKLPAGTDTITLTQTLTINDADGLTIENLGGELVTIEGTGSNMVINIPGAGEITLRGLRITGGAKGAVRSHFSDVWIDRSELTGNADTVLTNSYGSLRVTDSSIVDNDGMAVSTGYSSVDMTNVTISGNRAIGATPGILSHYGLITLDNVTVTENHGLTSTANPTVGTHGAVHAGTYGTILLRNSIIAGNVAGLDDATHDPVSMTDLDRTTVVYGPGAIHVDSQHNLIGAGDVDSLSDSDSTGDGKANQVGDIAGTILAPQLAPLGDYGGPTRTHALLDGSLALNAGDAALVPTGTGQDQRGVARVDAASGFLDLGAYEAHPTWVVDSVADGDDGDITSGQFTLREAIAAAAARPGDDTITFDLPSGSVITLTGGMLTVSTSPDRLIVEGPGADQLAIDGDGSSRLFHVNNGTLELNDLKLTGGYASSGSVVYGVGSVELNRVWATGNLTGNPGGAIQAFYGSDLVIRDSAITGNTGIGVSVTYGASGVITNTTISGNTNTGDSAGLYAQISPSNSLTLTNATIADNTATGASYAAGINVNYGTVFLYNSIVAGNQNANGAADTYGTFRAESADNLVGQHTGGSGLNAGQNTLNAPIPFDGQDPWLEPLALTSGSQTPTHRPIPGHAVADPVDTGNDAHANAAGLVADQRGQARFADGDFDLTSAVDIGAHELDPAELNALTLIGSAQADSQNKVSGIGVIASGTLAQDPATRVVIDWGDGTTPSVIFPNATPTPTLSHTYTDTTKHHAIVARYEGPDSVIASEPLAVNFLPVIDLELTGTSVPQGQRFRFVFPGRDPEGGELTYEWDNPTNTPPIPALALNAQTGEVTWDVPAGYTTPQTLRVKVTDDAGATATSLDLVLTPTNIAAGDLGGIAGYVYHDQNQNGVRDTQMLDGQSVNLDVVFVIDYSSSTHKAFGISADSPAPLPGNLNNDGFTNSILDGELRAFQALFERLGEFTGSYNAVVVAFDDAASYLGGGGQGSLSPDTPRIFTTGESFFNNGLPAGYTNAIKNGSGTNYEAALALVDDAFTNHLTDTSRDRLVVFLSDGRPSTGGEYLDELTTLVSGHGATVRAFGAGNTASLTHLRQLDPQAQKYENYAGTFSAFDGFRYGNNDFAEPGLDNWTVFLDADGDRQLDGNEASALTDANGNFSFTGLTAGTHDLVQIAPPGWAAFAPADGVQTVTLFTTADNAVEDIVGVGFGNIQAANQPPHIQSTPDTDATLGEPYTYGFVAFDDLDAPLTYAVAQGPDGDFRIDVHTGVVTWTPDALHAQAGELVSVVLTVSDGVHTVPHAYEILVSAAVENQAPYFTSDADEDFLLPSPTTDPLAIQTQLDIDQTKTFDVTIELPDFGVNSADVVILLDNNTHAPGSTSDFAPPWHWANDWDQLAYPPSSSWIEQLDQALEAQGLANNRFALATLYNLNEPDPVVRAVGTTAGGADALFGSASELAEAIDAVSRISTYYSSSISPQDAVLSAYNTYASASGPAEDTFRTGSQAGKVFVIVNGDRNSESIDADVPQTLGAAGIAVHALLRVDLNKPFGADQIIDVSPLHQEISGDWNIHTEADGQDPDGLYGRFRATPDSSRDEAIALSLYDPIRGGRLFEDRFVSFQFPDHFAGQGNAYVIFAYQDEDNFNFVGVDEVAGEFQVGRKLSGTWIVDLSTSLPDNPSNDPYGVSIFNTLDYINGNGFQLYGASGFTRHLTYPLDYFRGDYTREEELAFFSGPRGLATRGVEVDFVYSGLLHDRWSDWYGLESVEPDDHYGVTYWTANDFDSNYFLGLDAERDLSTGATIFRGYAPDFAASGHSSTFGSIVDFDYNSPSANDFFWPSNSHAGIEVNKGELIGAWGDLAWTLGGGVWSSELLSWDNPRNGLNDSFAKSLALAEAKRLLFEDQGYDLRVGQVRLGSEDVYQGYEITNIRRVVDGGQAKVVVDLAVTLKGVDAGFESVGGGNPVSGGAHDLDLELIDSTNVVQETIPVRIGEPYVYEMSATDPDDPAGLETLTYRFVGGSEEYGATIVGNRLVWEPTTGGVYTFELEVLDAYGGRGTQTVVVNVEEAAGVGDTENIQVSPVGTVTFEAGRNTSYQFDVDYVLEAQSVSGVKLRYALAENDDSRAGALLAKLAIDADTGQMYFVQKPTIFDIPDGEGPYQVKLIVTDGQGGRKETPFAIDVSPPNFDNEAPSFDGSAVLPTSVDVDELLRFQLVATDADSDRLTFTKVQGPAGLEVKPDGEVFWRPTKKDVGSQAVVVRVGDDRFGRDVLTFDIEVLPPNRLPLLLNEPGTVATVGKTYMHQVRAVDLDAETVSVNKVASVLPAGTFWADDYVGDFAADYGRPGSAGLLVYEPEAGDVPSVSLTLAVKDARGGVTSRTYSVEVRPASATDFAPKLSNAPRSTIAPGMTYYYRLHATDAGGDALMYSLTQGGTLPGASWDATSGVFSFEVPDDAVIGQTYSLGFSITDGVNTVPVSQTVTVRDNFENATPRIEPRAVHAAIVGQEYRLKLSATDNDADPVTWSLDEAPAGLLIDPQSGAIVWQPEADAIGVRSLMVRATDAYGESSTRRLLVSVRGAATAPRLIAQLPSKVLVGSTVNHQVLIDDADTEVARLTYDQSVLPEWLSLEKNELGVRLVGTVPSAGTVEGGVGWPVSLQISGPDGQQARFDFALTPTDTAADLDAQPLVSSTPFAAAVLGQTFSYTPTIALPSGSAGYRMRLESTLIDPARLSTNTAGNTVHWDTTGATPGRSYGMWLTVTDETTGQNSRQYFTVELEAANAAPSFDGAGSLATLDVEVIPGQPFAWDIPVTDADGDRLTFSIPDTGNLPEGAEVDEFGRVSWEVPTGLTPGPTTRVLNVLVTDRAGQTATYTINFAVITDSTGPIIDAFTVSDTAAGVGQTLLFQTAVSDNVAVADASLRVYDWDGVGETLLGDVPLATDGSATYETQGAGSLRFYLVATDVSGLVTTSAPISVTVSSLSDVDGPTASIDTDFSGGVIDASAPVTVSVSGGAGLTYRLDLIPQVGGSPIEVAGDTIGGATNVVAGTIDPRGLADGVYRLRLTASHNAGVTVVEKMITIASGAAKIGNFTLSFTDLTLPFGGLPLVAQRSYDTLAADQLGDFGFGWTLDLLGDGVEINHAGDDDATPQAPFRVGTSVSVTLPDGTKEVFNFTPQSTDPLFGLDGLGLSAGTGLVTFRPAFTNTGSSGSTLRLSQRPELQLDAEGVYRRGSGAAFSPAGDSGLSYILTLTNGSTFTFGAASGQVTAIQNTGGDRLTVADPVPDAGGPATVQSVIVDYGDVTTPQAELLIRRDANGRITSITNAASAKQVNYAYVADDLDTVTPYGGTAADAITYHYDDAAHPHFLTGIEDQTGVAALTVTYRPDGTLDDIMDAGGNTIGVEYQITGFTFTNGEIYEKVTDGPTDIEIIRDARGNVLREIRQLDAANQYLVTVNQYDNDERLTHASRPFVVTDTGFDRFGAAPTPYDSAEPVSVWKTINTYWDDSNRVRTATAHPGTDAEAITQYFYDDFGNVTVTIDALGGRTENVYDLDTGRLLESIDALGTRTLYTYDPDTGKVAQVTQQTADGAASIVASTLTYDPDSGLLIRGHSGGVSRHYGYDEDGNQTHSWYQWTDPDNVSNKKSVFSLTQFDYQGRQERTWRAVLNDHYAHADLPGIQSALDAAPRLNETITAYNDRGQTVKTTDALGHDTWTVYDKRGLQVESVSESIDRNGNPVWIVSRTVYDQFGRQRYQARPFAVSPGATEPDQPGYTPVAGQTVTGSRTDYDALGRAFRTEQLAAVVVDLIATGSGYFNATLTTETPYTTPLIQTTTYTDQGQTDTTTDANGFVTNYLYDAAGRQTTVIRNADLGQPDFTGPGSVVTTTQYDPLGRQTLVIDAQGHETRYEYDELGRQTAIIGPEVDNPHYNPNLATVELPRTRARTETRYDDFGRRGQEITGLRQFGGDASTIVGQSLARVTDFQYDDQNRLVAVTLPQVDNPSGPGKQRPRYEYAYDDFGNQTRLRDNVAGVVNLNSLELEGLYNHDGSGGDDYRDTTFTFDHFGRQVSRILPEGQTETFAYDSLGRLDLHVSFEGIHTKHTYDAFGRLASQTYYTSAFNYTNNSPDETATYTYDAFDRLVEVDQDRSGTDRDLITLNTYDPDGRLTQVRVDHDYNIISTDDQAVTNHGYDHQGRLQRTWTSHPTDDANAITDSSYAYDLFGRLQTVTTTERDDTPLTTAEVTTYVYTDNGSLLYTVLPANDQGDDVVSRYTYDEMNRLDLLEQFVDANGNFLFDQGTDTLLASFDYELTLEGQRSAVTETDDQGTTRRYEWAYDNADRLVSETYDVTYSPDPTGTASADEDYALRFSYDLVGNRLLQERWDASADIGPDTDAVQNRYEYDDNDRLDKEEQWTWFDPHPQPGIADWVRDFQINFQFDDTQLIYKTGNGSTTSYDYDNQGRLKQVTVTAAGTTTTTDVVYNHDGIRVRQDVTVNDGTNPATTTRTTFVIDDNNPTGFAQVIEERQDGTDADLTADYNEVLKAFTLGLDVVAQSIAANATGLPTGVSPGDPVFILADGLGSTRALITVAAQTLQRFAFDAYGNQLSGAAILDTDAALTHLLYRGEAFNPSVGLQYLRARWYDSNVGRFNRLDPFLGSSEAPQSYNKYLYAHSNPVFFFDPSGKISLGELLVSSAIRGGIGASLGGAGFAAIGANPVQGAIAGAQLAVGLFIVTNRVEAIVSGLVSSLLETAIVFVNNKDAGPNKSAAPPSGKQWGDILAAFSEGFFESAVDNYIDTLSGQARFDTSVMTLLFTGVRDMVNDIIDRSENHSSSVNRDFLASVAAGVVEVAINAAASQSGGGLSSRVNRLTDIYVGGLPPSSISRGLPPNDFNDFVSSFLTDSVFEVVEFAIKKSFEAGILPKEYA